MCVRACGCGWRGSGVKEGVVGVEERSRSLVLLVEVEKEEVLVQGAA